MVPRRKRKSKIIILPILLLVTAVVLLAGLFLMNRGELELRLEGDGKIILEYGECYQEPGVTAFFDGEVVQAQIVVDQQEMVKVGTYIISYEATYKKHTCTIERTVQVVDTQAPVITLQQLPGYCTEVGKEYEEEGYIATDNYDGDITAQVERIEEDGVVYYTVKDSSGNTATAERIIVYGDSVLPQLTLLGDAVLHLTVDALYNDPGFTAQDNIDGDLSGNVVVTGEYDLSTPGSYTITYTVTDAHGNTASAERQIVVEQPQRPATVKPDEKVIYLTFDDGPTKHTVKLLEILERYGAKATFFVVGSMDLSLLDDIAGAGHAIGIHSNTHVYKNIYASEEAFFEDFQALRKKIFDHTGIDTRLCRFPGGGSNTASKKYCKGIMSILTEKVQDMGYQYFDWNVDSGDAGGAKTAEEVYKNVIAGIGSRKHAVVLQHDLYEYSVDAVEMIIQWGLENGYEFRALDVTSPAAHHPVYN